VHFYIHDPDCKVAREMANTSALSFLFSYVVEDCIILLVLWSRHERSLHHIYNLETTAISPCYLFFCDNWIMFITENFVYKSTYLKQCAWPTKSLSGRV
jgi:hypothetical protein